MVRGGGGHVLMDLALQQPGREGTGHSSADSSGPRLPKSERSLLGSSPPRDPAGGLGSSDFVRPPNLMSLGGEPIWPVLRGSMVLEEFQCWRGPGDPGPAERHGMLGVLWNGTRTQNTRTSSSQSYAVGPSG